MGDNDRLCAMVEKVGTRERFKRSPPQAVEAGIELESVRPAEQRLTH